MGGADSASPADGLAPLLPFVDPFGPPFGDRVPLVEVGRRLAVPLPLLPPPLEAPLFELLDPVARGFSEADASIAASPAGSGRRVLPFEPPVPFDLAPPLADDVPAAFGLGSGRSLRSATAVLAPDLAPSALGGGGPATMPFRNRISWVRILMALDTMK